MICPLCVHLPDLISNFNLIEANQPFEEKKRLKLCILLILYLFRYFYYWEVMMPCEQEVH